MKLTPFAKFFITVVILGVIGYAVWHYKGADIRKWAGAEQGAAGTARRQDRGRRHRPTTSTRSRTRRPTRARQGRGRRVRRGARRHRQARPAARRRHQHLGRPRAGHRGQRRHGADPASRYKQSYGLDVKFVLLEDPAAKLAAFRKGDVDIMWNTVDNWAREASILAEQNQKAKSIIMQDWSRGGDGIVSLSSIKSIEDLKGHKIACTQFTPSHFLLLYLLAQSGLSPEDRAARREEHHLHAGRAGGRRHVQGEAGGRGGHVGAGPLGGGDGARRRGARPRLDDGRHQHHRRHAVRAAGPDRPGARDGARLRPRLVRRHRDDQGRPGRGVRRRRPRR